MKNYTNIEQSKKLLELGLNPESADMYYPYDGISTYPNIEDGFTNVNSVPCWSVGALWSLMPKIKTEYGIIRPKSVKEESVNFSFRYYYETLYSTDMRSTPIEAAYDMVVWLLENNYIKKECIMLNN